MKNHVFEKDKVWSSILGRFWLPNGTQMLSKMVQKRHQKSIKKMIAFLIDFRGHQGLRQGRLNVQDARGEVAAQEFPDHPPSPKLLAKANSDMNKVHGAN